MRNSYSDKQIAEALAILATCTDKKTGKPNYSEGARKTGIPRKTLIGWATDTRRAPVADVAELRQEKKTELADLLESLVRTLVGRAVEITPDCKDLGKIMVGVGIGSEKMQLLRGQPTAINQELTPAAIDQEINEIAEAAKKRALNEPRTSNTA